MRALILVLILALGTSGWATSSAAQSVGAINSLALSAENAAPRMRSLAASTLKAARSILGNDILMAIVSHEAELIRQTSTASALALYRLAEAHELLAAKLRREAARLEREQQKKN